jgi:hypothetical protein
MTSTRSDEKDKIKRFVSRRNIVFDGEQSSGDESDEAGNIKGLLNNVVRK